MRFGNDGKKNKFGQRKDPAEMGAFRDLCPAKQKLVIKGLGFTRLNQVIERPDTQAIRGMVAKVPHLVAVVD